MVGSRALAASDDVSIAGAQRIMIVRIMIARIEYLIRCFLSYAGFKPTPGPETLFHNNVARFDGLVRCARHYVAPMRKWLAPSRIHMHQRAPYRANANRQGRTTMVAIPAGSASGRSAPLRTVWQRLAQALDRLVTERSRRAVSPAALRRAKYDLNRCRRLMLQSSAVRHAAHPNHNLIAGRNHERS